MFFSKKIDIMKLAYMYHHFSGIYLLSRDSREVPIGDMLFWGELSNLPSYPLYYYLHEDNSLHKEKIVFLQLLQKILYTGIRVPLLTQKLIQYLLTAPNYKHLFAIMPVYLMGIIWGGKIITQKLKKGIDEGEDVAELIGDSSLSTVRLCLFYFLQSKIF
jgi:hypothetical protein